MMSGCHLYLRLLLAVFAVSAVTAASTASSSAITSTNTTAVPTASTNVSTSVPSSTTINTNTTAAPTTTLLPGTTNITSTVQVATTASTELPTTTAAGGMNTTVSSNNSTTTANATTTLPNITGSASVTANGNMTTPSPSQGTATTAPLNTTAGPQGNVTTSPNNTAAGPQGNTTMHTSPVTPTMTSTTGAPSSAVSTNASIGVANSTTALPTESPPTTTTTQTTTTNTAPNVSTRPLNPDVFFVLNLTMGPNSNINCVVGNCNPEVIRNLTTRAFLGRAGFYDVRIVPMTNRRKRDVMPVHVEVRFIASRLLELPQTNVSEMVMSALQQLNDSGSFIIKFDVMVTIADDFALTSRDVCQAVGVCDLGYVCVKRGVEAACYYLCDEDSTWSCGEHGTCQVHVMGGQAHKSCKCASDYDNVWSGDKCQDSEISGEKKARIAGGVLGAFCGVFIIIIIVLLVLRGGCCGGTSSQKTYDLTL